MVGTKDLRELAGWGESPTTAGAIHAALLRIWRDASVPRRRGDGRSAPVGGVVRTRVANLLVYSATPEDAERAARTLGELALRHPVRSILLTGSAENAPDALGATVRVFCRPSLGHRVCFEQIRLTAGDRAARLLASMASQLLVHDLPTLLWWPGSPPFDSELFSQLSELADVLVFDSGEFDDPAIGLMALGDGARPLRGLKVIADLNWNRLADWRELMAQFFDHTDARPALDQLTAVEIEVATPGGPVASAQALLLAGWLGSRLGWRCGPVRDVRDGLHLRLYRGRSPVDVRLHRSRGEGQPTVGVRAVRLEAGAGTTAQRFCLESEPATAHGTATTDVAGGCSNSRCFVLQERSEAELLSEELETIGREHALDDALDFAGQIAARLRGRRPE